jgi:hypothetical protein
VVLLQAWVLLRINRMHAADASHYANNDATCVPAVLLLNSNSSGLTTNAVPAGQTSVPFCITCSGSCREHTLQVG